MSSENRPLFPDLAPSKDELLKWNWTDFEPYYRELETFPLSAENLSTWLAGWSAVLGCVKDLSTWLYVATTVNTADQAAKAHYEAYLEDIFPRAMQAEQRLKRKLLASGLSLPGMEVPIHNMRLEADLFREENLPLLAEEQKLCNQFHAIVGAETVMWQGREATLKEIQLAYLDGDRSVREHAWRLKKQRQLADRQAINELWQKMLALRTRIAANAGKPDYRAYRWQQLLRSDYTPEDSRKFHAAIEQVVTPALARINERRRQRMGVAALRPWDLDVDALDRPPLRPFTSPEELVAGVSAIFHHVDPQFGAYFDTLRNEGLLDVANRKNRADGAYCAGFVITRKPFIFASVVGVQRDVETLLHESGHSFHAFEESRLPYVHQQIMVSEFFTEFAEVASMGMELLASPYLGREFGGFYTPQEAARARIAHLEHNIWFWPYMAVVDAFQHWVYENPERAMDAANCDAQWDNLWQRYIPVVDWSGLEEERMTGWQRKHHIHTLPFYYIEYGLAQLGALQIWGNALKDQAGAVASYRRALSLGGTVPLADLYRAAGARLSFDASTLRAAVDLMEHVIEELEEAAAG